MNQPTVEQEIQQTLNHLQLEQKLQVLEFARNLAVAPIRGVPGSALLRFAGAIHIDDLATISQAVNEDCETVDSNEW